MTDGSISPLTKLTEVLVGGIIALLTTVIPITVVVGETERQSEINKDEISALPTLTLVRGTNIT